MSSHVGDNDPSGRYFFDEKSTDLETVALAEIVKINLIEHHFIKGQQISVETYHYLLKELEPLGQKMQTALCYAIDYKTMPNGNFINPISTRYDPLEVFQMLSHFEERVGDSDEIVLLPACTVFKTEDTLLGGEVTYEQDRFGYWYAVIGESKIHVGNISKALWTKEAVEEHAQRRMSLEHIPVLGREAVDTFFRMYRNNATSPLCAAA